MRTLVAAVVMVVAACGGSPPDLGTIRPRDPPPDMDHDWIVVTVEGFVLAPGTAPIDQAAHFLTAERERSASRRFETRTRGPSRSNVSS
ncbi:MAG TPA: hypothetical protein VFO78_09665 [Candidatus Limnocylindrales bacterium]|nr:hypothetical protein [Candidatus Limnocylindrales bacterium]